MVAFGPRKPRPNVVLVVIDTLRGDALSERAGAPNTPALDALAREGVSFSRAFAHAPMTLPAHTAMFASRTPSEAGVTNNGQPVPQDLPLLAEHLAEHGYRTAAAVSLATLWPLAPGQGLDRGFDRFEPGVHPIADSVETGKRVEALLEELSADEPFFLFAHFADPHEPYEAHGTAHRSVQIELDGLPLDEVSTSDSSEWRREVVLGPGAHRLVVAGSEPFRLRSFAAFAGEQPISHRWLEGEAMQPTRQVHLELRVPSGGPHRVRLEGWLCDVPTLAEIRERYRLEVESADRAVGRLLDALRRRGLFENALVVVTGDHGEALGEHGCVGHVVNLHEEMLRVPLVMRLPGGERPPWFVQRAHQLVRHVDLAPTILDLAGIEAWDGMQGRSLRLDGRRALLAETHPPEAPRELYALRDEEYSLVFDAAQGRFRMYDLAADPLELDDVFPRAGHLRREWQVQLERLAERDRAGGPELAPGDHRRLEALGYLAPPDPR